MRYGSWKTIGLIVQCDPTRMKLVGNRMLDYQMFAYIFTDCISKNVASIIAVCVFDHMCRTSLCGRLLRFSSNMPRSAQVMWVKCLQNY